jgi:hypothetical protein
MNATCPRMSPFSTPRIWPFLILCMTSSPGTRSPCCLEGKEGQSWLDQLLDEAVILLDQVLQGVDQALVRPMREGFPIKSACFQVRTILARKTRSTRSVFWETGRLIRRRKMINWCRNEAFSASSSAFLLVRSATVPSTRKVVGGLIHRATCSWSV